jgi:hypothetical protein
MGSTQRNFNIDLPFTEDVVRSVIRHDQVSNPKYRGSQLAEQVLQGNKFEAISGENGATHS